MRLEKFLTYAVLFVALFGLLTLKSQMDTGFKWESKKYDYLTRIELETTLERAFGEGANDFFYKATGQYIAEATDQGLRDYLYQVDKDVFPMESIADEHEASMEIDKMSRLGRVVVFFLLFLGGVKILKRYNIGDKHRIIRFLKKFDVGFKGPDKKDEK